MRLLPIIITLSIFILLATQGLMNVGIYYDEVLHAVAGQKIIIPAYQSEVHHPLAIKIFNHTFPIMILYYVGALKSYILACIFLIFPNNLLTVRLFTIICATVNIILTYIITQKMFNKKIAYISTLLLAIDPSFILSARYDWGPLVLQTMMKLTLIYLFLQIKTSNHQTALAICLGVTTGILIWDKLNAIWFIIPIYLVFIDTLTQLKHKKINLISYLIGLGCGLTPLIIFIIKRPFFYEVSQNSFKMFETYAKLNTDNKNLTALLQNYNSNNIEKLTTTLQVLNGTKIPNYILTTEITAPHIFTGLIIGAYLTIFIKLYKNRATNETIKKIYQTAINKIALITTGTFLFIIITPHANGPHHIMTITPFTHIMAGWLLAQTKQKIAYILIASLLITNLQTLTTFNINTKQNNMKIYWQRTQLEELSRKLKEINKPTIALDWGITLPVGFFTNGSIQIQDLQAFYEPKCSELINKLQNKQYIAVRFTEGNKLFPTYYTQCEETLINKQTKNIGVYEIINL